MCVLLGPPEDELRELGGQRDNLTAVMESMGIYDTDLRARGNNASTVTETRHLLKILLTALKKAVAQGQVSVQSNHGETSTGSAVDPDLNLSQETELALQTNYTEVR